MSDSFEYFRETLAVCPVESAGACVALPERDVIAVLPLDDDALDEICGILAVGLDDRERALISLRTALCQPAGPAQTVVVLRIGHQLFGLLVDQAFDPIYARVHPTVTAAPEQATFCAIVRLEDGRDVPLLNPDSLLESVQPKAPGGRLAA